MPYDERIKVGKPCQRCEEMCVAFLQGKVSDLFWLVWPGGKEQSGYVPPDDLCGVRAGDDSDYMNLNLCLACGQVQGDWPKKSVKKWLANRPLKRFEFAIMEHGGVWRGEHFADAQDAEQAREIVLERIKSVFKEVVEVVLVCEQDIEEEEE